jgi:elongation factor Ts
MADFSAADVARLRRSTGVGMLDARRALQENDGDMEAATQWLRVQGLASAAKRSGREASQGAVAVAKLGADAAVVELRCETDFVAKAPDFVSLVEEIAASVAAKGEEAVEAFGDQIDQLRTALKENISVGRAVHLHGAEGEVVDTYLHQQAGRGVNGVAVVLHGGPVELAHEIALHIASAKPLYLRREDVPAEDVERERATMEEISRNEGKPEAALPKIIDGRMNGWFRDRCLMEQAYVRDEKRSIADLLGSAEVVRFTQVVIGG